MRDTNLLRAMFEGIRDERRTAANTAERIGNAFLALLDYMGDVNLDGKYLSKEHADTALGLITFAAGLTSEALATFVQGLVSQDVISAQQGVTFGTFVQGLYDGTGGRIDGQGNGELESLRVRSFLEVVELIINRLQAQEGDTLFTDNDQIEDLEQVIDDTDGSVSYVLTLKAKWEGYITGQQYGNVIKGIINTLAAKYAGVSDFSATSVES